MSAIAHAFAEQNTNQTRTGSTAYGDISGATIASGSFTAGKKYLLYCTAQVAGNNTGDDFGIRAIHGSTAFADSEHQFRHIATNFRATFNWWTVWTAVSSEAITLQFATLSNSARTVSANKIAMMAICLSDNVTENTDWHFAERTTDDSLSTTPTDGAAITFTPGTASHDWLVLSLSRIDPTSVTTSYISELNRSGEASSAAPQSRVELDNTATGCVAAMARVFTLGTASNTFKEISSSTGTTHTRLYSAVFAIDLHKFKNHAFVYTAGDTNLSATDYATQLATVSLTPDVQGDVWIGGYWGFDVGAAGRECKQRIQVDNSDAPTGQTTDDYVFRRGGDATDEEPLNINTMVANMTAAGHTIDLDASADSATSTPAGQHICLWAVTMELAAGAQTVAVGQVTETDLAQSIAWAPKRRLIVQVTESDLAQAVAWAPKKRLVGQVSEVSLAQSLTASKAKALAQVLETDLAQSVAWAPKHRLVGQVTESDSAQAITRIKLQLLGQVSETDSAQSVAWEIRRLISQISETDLAQAIGTGGLVVAVDEISESDLAQAVAWQRRRLVAQVSEADIAQSVSRIKTLSVGQVLETDLAQTLNRIKTLALGQVVESDLAQAINRLKSAGIIQVIETDTAAAIVWNPKVRLVGQVLEVDLAQDITLFDPGAGIRSGLVSTRIYLSEHARTRIELAEKSTVRISRTHTSRIA